MKKSRSKKSLLIGSSFLLTAIPFAAISCARESHNVATLQNNKEEVTQIYTQSIDQSISHDAMQKIVQSILDGQINKYTLNGETYDISGDLYATNIKPLVNFIQTNFPTIAAPDDKTISDIPIYDFKNISDFQNIVQSVQPNHRFATIHMPYLPKGYIWEFSSDQLYQHKNLDGTFSRYWTKALSNFIVPDNTTEGQKFVFMARVAPNNGFKVLPTQVQEQTFTVAINY